MAVKGVFASDRHIQGARKGDFASAVLQLEPTGSAPLFALSSGMESVDASDTIVTWFEENHLSGRVGIVNAAGVGTSLEVEDASFIVPGSVFLVESTGEFVFVEQVVGNTLTVLRGFAETTAAAIDGSVTPVYIQKIGTGHEEGSSRPQAVSQLGYPRFNYVQIFRNAWDVTGTARAVEYLTGDLVAKSKADCARYHAEDIERSIIFGRKFLGVKKGKPFRMMDGINTQIKTNVEVAAGPTSWDDIDLFLQAIFSRNIKGKPNERIAFCGNTALRVLNNIARNYSMMNIEPGVTEFGMKVNKWITPFGDISLMTHPLMNENPLWSKDLYIYHPGAVRMRYLRRTIDKTYTQDSGDDTEYGVLTTELTVEYRAEITGGKFIGLSEAARPVMLTEQVQS